MPKGFDKSCLVCGKSIHVIPSREKQNRGKYCSKSCMSEAFKRKFAGKNNPFWKGENYTFVSIANRGNGKYKQIYKRMVKQNGKWRPEHIIIAEEALGRSLKKGENVHHINCDSLDNRKTNLLICSSSYHGWLHSRYALRFAELHLRGDVYA